MQWTWDPKNAEIHKAKHSIDFKDAETALNDPNAYTLYSPRRNEDRYQTFCELNDQIICVIHTRSENATTIAQIRGRIISIRPAVAKRESYTMTTETIPTPMCNPEDLPNDIPDDQIDFSDIPEIEITPWSYRGITGLFALPPDGQRKAISFLNRERAIREETPNALPTDPPARALRYTREDMDSSVRRCAAVLDDNAVCNASFRVSDFPVGYYPFKEQVQSPTYANACPICECKADRRIAAITRDRHFSIALLDDADFLENHHENHHNARITGKTG